MGSVAKIWECVFLGQGRREIKSKLEGSLSFVGMKLVLVIIKAKHRIMISYIQYTFSTSTTLSTRWLGHDWQLAVFFIAP